jgi:hypothetical protein
MLSVALEMPSLFKDMRVPLLLSNSHATADKTTTTTTTTTNASDLCASPSLLSQSVTLSHRQVACLLAHSAFGSITASARLVRKEKWAFRAAQLFFLEALPSAFCFLNYFKLLGQRGFPSSDSASSSSHCLRYERRSFPRGRPPFAWERATGALCGVEVVDGAIEASRAEAHVDFGNRYERKILVFLLLLFFSFSFFFVFSVAKFFIFRLLFILTIRFIGGGCLECDFMMEEILFAIKPELIVAMALCSFMQDDEAIIISGARQYYKYSGYASSFEFQGDFEAGDQEAAMPMVLAMDALQGMAKIQFQEGLLRRDLNKARVAFSCFSRVELGEENKKWHVNLVPEQHESSEVCYCFVLLCFAYCCCCFNGFTLTLLLLLNRSLRGSLAHSRLATGDAARSATITC